MGGGQSTGVITETVFEELLKGRMSPAFWERALKVFSDYGSSYSFDVTSVLMYAVDQGKEEVVLQELEKHWKEDLSFEHPDLRGVGIRLSTAMLFGHLCATVLGLQPMKI